MNSSLFTETIVILRIQSEKCHPTQLTKSELINRMILWILKIS